MVEREYRFLLLTPLFLFLFLSCHLPATSSPIQIIFELLISLTRNQMPKVYLYKLKTAGECQVAHGFVSFSYRLPDSHTLQLENDTSVIVRSSISRIFPAMVSGRFCNHQTNFTSILASKLYSRCSIRKFIGCRNICCPSLAECVVNALNCSNRTLISIIIFVFF